MANFPRGLRVLVYGAAAAAFFAAALLSVDQIARATYRLPDNAATLETPDRSERLTTSALSNEPAESWTDSYFGPSLYPGEFGPFGHVVRSSNGPANFSAFELPEISLPAIASTATLPVHDLNLGKAPTSETNFALSQPVENAAANPLGPFKLILPGNPASTSDLSGLTGTSLPQVSAPSVPTGGLLRR
jgi:hypothetical protein